VRNFLPLLLCFVLTIFGVARGVQQAHTSAADTKTNQRATTGQQRHANLFVDHETSEEVGSDDDDSAEGASNDEGEDTNGDDNGNSASSQDTGDDDEGTDDGGDSADDQGSGETPR
jgi:hypothetical protein